MVADTTVPAGRGQDRARRVATDLREVPERDPLHGPIGRRLAHAAEGFPALADGVLVVP